MNSSHSNNNNRTREEKWSKKSQPFEAFDGALEVRYIGAMGGDKVRRNLNIGGYSPPKVSYFPPLNESPTRKHMLMNNEIKGSWSTEQNTTRWHIDSQSWIRRVGWRKHVVSPLDLSWKILLDSRLEKLPLCTRTEWWQSFQMIDVRLPCFANIPISRVASGGPTVWTGWGVRHRPPSGPPWVHSRLATVPCHPGYCTKSSPARCWYPQPQR